VQSPGSSLVREVLTIQELQFGSEDAQGIGII
jgi:hypothetical protein